METTRIWSKAATVRAIKTFAQAMAAQITVGSAFSELNWKMIFSSALVSAIYSILTSLAGLPEVQDGVSMEDDEDAEY